MLVLIIVLMLLAAGFGAWGMQQYLELTRPEREQALVAELEALRAAQRLSISAWQARMAMAEEARRYTEGGGA